MNRRKHKVSKHDKAHVEETFDQRQVSLVERVEVPFEGSLLPAACALGDVDGDGDQELVVGNCDGKLFVYKHGALHATYNDLGTIVAVFVQNDFARKGAADIVVINGEGSCHVLAVPVASAPRVSETLKLESIAIFDIPWNVTCAHFCDLFERGQELLVLASSHGGLISETTVNAYRVQTSTLRRSGVPRRGLDAVIEWPVPGAALSMSHTKLPNTKGKLILVGLQFGGIVSLTADGGVLRHHFDDKNKRPADNVGRSSPNGPGPVSREGSFGAGGILGQQPEGTLLVSRPTIVFGLQQQQQQQRMNTHSPGKANIDRRLHDSAPTSSSSSSSFLTKPETAQSSARPRPKSRGGTATNVAGRTEGSESLRQVMSQGNSQSDLSRTNSDDEERRGLAVLCFGSTLRLERIADGYAGRGPAYITNQLVWQEEQQCQLFAVQSLDINQDGNSEIVSCAWNGLTCIYDLDNNVVRYQFESRVQGFLAGHYSCTPGQTSACFIYVTFDKSIVICHDVRSCVQSIPALTLLDVLSRRGELKSVLNGLEQARPSKEKNEHARALGKAEDTDKSVIEDLYIAKLLRRQLHAPLQASLPSSPPT